MTTPKKEINFTARDFELLAKAMTCTKEPMNIDYNKLAEAAPFKNANSAKASWHGLKKKIDALAEGAPLKGATEGDGSITPAKTPSKKRKAEPAKAEEDDEAGGEAESTPAKKTSKKARTSSAKGKGKAEVKSETSDAEDGEQSQAAQEDDADATAGAVKIESSDD